MKSSLHNQLFALGQPHKKAERRGGRRIVPNEQTVALLRTEDNPEIATALVRNLSAKGVAVLAQRNYPLGTMVHVLFINASHTFSLAAKIEIARSKREGSQLYLIAGSFSQPLQHEQIVPLIV